MLVLSRQIDESIMIGDNVEITIVDIRGGKVRLGITAPSEIPVHRKEVYETIKRESVKILSLSSLEKDKKKIIIDGIDDLVSKIKDLKGLTSDTVEKYFDIFIKKNRKNY